MNIKKVYTRTLHDELVGYVQQGKMHRQEYPNGKFIKRIQVRKEGILFIYCTVIPTHSGLTHRNFLTMGYNEVVNLLQEVYNKTQENKLYGLESPEERAKYRI